jgi:hypothetical protein
MLAQFQDFYNTLGEVAREKVILTYNHPIFSHDNYNLLLNRLTKRKKIGEFDEPKQVNKLHLLSYKIIFRV